MNRKLGWLIALTELATFLVLGGCSREVGTLSGPAASAGFLPNTAAALGRKHASVRIGILIPRSHDGRHRRFVSPATQSMRISVKRGRRKVVSTKVNLTPASPGCSDSLAGTLCSVSIEVPPGTGYSASLTAYDGLNATGNALSTDQRVAFKVAAGKTNTLSLTLSGIPKTLVAKALSGTSVYVGAQDADGNFIVGPGAPRFTASRGSGSTVVSITQPSATSPNVFTVALVSPAPSVGATETIAVTASYPAGTTNACTTPGAVCSLAQAATARDVVSGTYFVADFGSNEVKGFSTPLASFTQAPSYALSVASPSDAGLDSSGDLFVMDWYGGSLYEFKPPYTGAPVTDAISISAANGMAFNSAGTLFLGNQNDLGVAEVASPYTGSATVITSGVDFPYDVAVDADDNLYAANSVGVTLGVYAPGSYTTQEYSVALAGVPYSLTRKGSNLYVGEARAVEIFSLPITSSSATPIARIINGVKNAFAVAFDAAGDMFVSNNGAGTITEYAAPIRNGESATVTLSKGLVGPCRNLRFDVNDFLYVADETAGTIVEFAPPFTTSSAPVQTITGLAAPCNGGLVDGSTRNLALSVP